MTTVTPSRLQAERADESRARILDAALQEFAAHGLAGARIDQIASAAGVNKALLYYYFESKEKLYTAALEGAAARVRDTTMAVFLRDASAGERVLRIALGHFDRIASQGEFQRLMQQEMMRHKNGESDAIPVLVKRVFSPMHAMFESILREGATSGELIDADAMQISLAALGANVFYFLSAPVWRLLMSFDPLSKEAILARRASAIRFLGQALFVDRFHGATLAERVLADTPAHELKLIPNMFGEKDESSQ
jgi:TetR/AcrR family transcriptional regulator